MRLFRGQSDAPDRLFRQNIESLLKQHPLDSVDEDGEPFWTGARRARRPIRFVAGAESNSQQGKVNENMLMFVQVVLVYDSKRWIHLSRTRVRPRFHVTRQRRPW
jgi:hypothetical protein